MFNSFSSKVVPVAILNKKSATDVGKSDAIHSSQAMMARSRTPTVLILHRMGYKAELHRGLGSLMSFSFGFTGVAVLVSVCLGFGAGLGSGGPTVSKYTSVRSNYSRFINA